MGDALSSPAGSLLCSEMLTTVRQLDSGIFPSQLYGKTHARDFQSVYKGRKWLLAARD